MKERVMATFREFQVQRSERLTENMQRVVLFSTELDGFPVHADGGYIKFLFHPDSGAAIANGTELAQLHGSRPTLRTYTIRHYDQGKQQIVVDFVLHGRGQISGPASAWAVSAQPNDTILVGGPGPVTIINTQADWLLFAGDMTALPAISVNLEQLPETAKGVAVIQINSAADKVNLKKPENVDIIWVIRPESLLEKVKSLAWPQGQVSVWAASEFLTMRALRDYFKVEQQLDKQHIYISSYWKQGINEEQHKVIKREDAESQNGLTTNVIV